ncbi:hypothetical protein GE118_03435 [Mycoplasma sp. NEAQ87857]|uniref:hypothetical protein n=1 Tax=Mycoplasma sp. NEAQ87857 TaxID=2683967 RepID=UPI001315DA6D|nr:hypothetical protein [Mycoplasma sp. NEAQ87857]QGZ97838.1 hypothetical protein GE118_03435 [Mycoplasma sp. NEAQ87857]
MIRKFITTLGIFVPIVSVSCASTSVKNPDNKKEATIPSLIVEKFNLDKNKSNINKQKRLWLKNDFRSIGSWSWSNPDYKLVLDEWHLKKILDNSKLLTTIEFVNNFIPIKETKNGVVSRKYYDVELSNKEYENLIHKNIFINGEFTNKELNEIKIPWSLNKLKDNKLLINYFTGEYIRKFSLKPNPKVSKNEWKDIFIFHQIPVNYSSFYKEYDIWLFNPDWFEKVQKDNPNLKINIFLTEKSNLEKIKYPYFENLDLPKHSLIIDFEYTHKKFYETELINDFDYNAFMFDKGTLYLIKDTSEHYRPPGISYVQPDKPSFSFTILGWVSNQWRARYFLFDNNLKNDSNSESEKLITSRYTIAISLNDEEIKNFELKNIEFLNIDFSKEFLKKQNK